MAINWFSAILELAFSGNVFSIFRTQSHVQCRSRRKLLKEWWYLSDLSLKYQIMACFVTRVRAANGLDTNSIKIPVPNRLRNPSISNMRGITSKPCILSFWLAMGETRIYEQPVFKRPWEGSCRSKHLISETLKILYLWCTATCIIFFCIHTSSNGSQQMVEQDWLESAKYHKLHWEEIMVSWHRQLSAEENSTKLDWGDWYTSLEDSFALPVRWPHFQTNSLSCDDQIHQRNQGIIQHHLSILLLWF